MCAGVENAWNARRYYDPAGPENNTTLPHTHVCVCFFTHTSWPCMHGKTVSIDDLRRCLTFRPFFLLSARNPHMVGACGNVLGGNLRCLVSFMISYRH